MGRAAKLWAWVIVAAMLARFAVAAVSFGSNDAAAWRHFAEAVGQDGLLHTYRTEGEFNHPPLPGYWAAAALAIAGSSGTIAADALFTNIFKLPAILADGLGVWLLWRIWRPRSGPNRAAAVAAAFALSLDAICVSAYHCNTDSIYVALCLLAIYLIEDKGQDFWGGFALGAAINVKIIPVLLLPAMILSYRQPGRLARFAVGLACWIVPFIPPALWVGKPFVSHLFAYNSLLDRWGLNFFLLLGMGDYFVSGSRAGLLAVWYYFHGKYAVIGAVLAWAVLVRIIERWNRYEAAVVSFALFLVLTPGFGVQYTVLPGLLLFATRPRLGAIYGLVSGLFVAAAYWHNWTGTWPAMSQWTSLLPMWVAWIGLATWALLIGVVVLTWRNRPTRLDGQVVGLRSS
jgi:hypothetical protein